MQYKNIGFKNKMKLKIERKVLILIILGIIFAISLTNNNNLKINLDNDNLKISIVSGPIHIDDLIGPNWSVAEAAGICTGKGTSSEPYVIEDLVLDCEGSGKGIWVENSDVYFKIENCTIYNSGTINYEDFAIKLVSVKNAIINNSDFYNNGWGIFLDYSENNTIVGNAFTNDKGINLEYSNYNTIYLNNLRNSLNVFTFSDTSNNNLWNSPEQLKYTYEGKSYTNYLGNFWNNYRGGDAGGDGIGDTPVIFYDSDEITMDYYPLMEENDNYEIGKTIEESGGTIPGYTLSFLIGMISIASIILQKKLKESLK